MNNTQIAAIITSGILESRRVLLTEEILNNNNETNASYGTPIHADLVAWGNKLSADLDTLYVAIVGNRSLINILSN